MKNYELEVKPLGGDLASTRIVDRRRCVNADTAAEGWRARLAEMVRSTGQAVYFAVKSGGKTLLEGAAAKSPEEMGPGRRTLDGVAFIRVDRPPTRRQR